MGRLHGADPGFAPQQVDVSAGRDRGGPGPRSRHQHWERAPLESLSAAGIGFPWAARVEFSVVSLEFWVFSFGFLSPTSIIVSSFQFHFSNCIIQLSARWF